jgi:hypothetical protein
MKWMPLSSPAFVLLAALCVFNGEASTAHHSHAAKRHRAQTPPGWHTYRNSDYGFSIAYPASLKPVDSARGENTGGSMPLCDDTTIACFAYTGQSYKGTNFQGAGFAINVVRDATSEQACRNLDSTASSSPGKITIFDTRFDHNAIAEGAMSHQQAGDSYRTYRQGVCFEMKTGINTVSLGVYDPGTLKPFHPEKLRLLLRDMADTFRFIGPVKYGAAWKISRDSGCGGTFEYPADATAQITAENIASRPNSDRITCSRSFTFGGRDYTLDVKNGRVDDAWLKSSGYVPLNNAMVVSRSAHYTDYQAGSYYYVYRPGLIYIFSASGPEHRAIDPESDPIYRHWLASFRP